MFDVNRFTSLVWIAAVAMIPAVFGGCRLIADYDVTSSEEGRRDQRVAFRDSAALDGRWFDGRPRHDALADVGGGDSARHDTMPSDLAFSKPLICDTPVAVGDMTALYLTGGPTLRVDGLTIIALQKAPWEWKQATRSAWGQRFGDWKKCQIPAPDQGDPTFFNWNRGEYQIATSGPKKPRKLQLCKMLVGTTCRDITLETPQNIAIEDDVDGPEVVVLPSGDLLMVHNVATKANGEGDVYLAHPKVNPPKKREDLRVWVTSPVPTLALPAVKEDDPTLSPDGLVILFFARIAANSPEELWVSRRASLTAAFPPPILLNTANSKGRDTEPSFAKVPGKPGQVELFFMSDRKGTGRVYRSVCRL